jgi:hypothetical protein
MRAMRPRWRVLFVVMALLAACGGTPAAEQGDAQSSQGDDVDVEGQAQRDGAGSNGDEASQPHVLTTTLNLGSEGAAEDPWCADDLGPYRVEIISDRGTNPSLTVRLDDSAANAVASTVELDVAVSVSEQRGNQGRECSEKVSMRSPVAAQTSRATTGGPVASSVLTSASGDADRATASVIALATEGADDAGTDAGTVETEPNAATEPPGDDDAQTNGDGSTSGNEDEPEEPSTKPLVVDAHVVDGHGTCSFTSTSSEAAVQCTFDAPAQDDARSVIVALPDPDPAYFPDVSIALSMRLR